MAPLRGICRYARVDPETRGRRAVPLAHEAALLPWRIADAEQNLRQAETAAAAEAAARG